MREHGIGDTIFTRSRNIEKKLNTGKLFLKFEGGNPTGTMKDRASYACIRKAICADYKQIVIASCGNFGASFVYFSKKLGMESHVYIPQKYKSPRIPEIKEMGGVVHRVKGTYEDAVEISTKDATMKGWYNGNPGNPENTDATLRAYSLIAYEIFEVLGRVPDVVSVPTGNGTTLAGIYEGWKNLLGKGLTKKIPKMVAISTTGGNPIIKSYETGRTKISELDPSEIRETEHNEPLVSWKSMDGQLALNAINESNGWALGVTDEEMIEYSRLLLQQEGLSVLPASASSLAATKSKEKKLVTILTARGV